MKISIEIEKKSYEVTVELPHGAHNGHRHWEPGEVEIPESVMRTRPQSRLLEDTYCRAPIAGRVTAVVAASGQSLRKNEPVLVIEAMKMEIQIGAAVDGVLKTVHVKPGEAVSPGQLMFELN